MQQNKTASSSKEAATIRFFIALLPPSPVQAYAATIIQELTQRYQSRTSKSPPHITLQPPFHWPLAMLPPLETYLSEFAAQQPPIPVQLDGFGAFAPRVLYINVVKTPVLLAQQAALMNQLADTFGIGDPKDRQRPFTPHLTIASRNLTRQTFRQAWTELQERSVQFEFVVQQLTLLIYQEQRWHIHAEFPLRSG